MCGGAQGALQSRMEWICKEFLAAIDPCLLSVRRELPEQAHHIGHAAGQLNVEWANRLGLTEGIPVAVGMIDAHAGAVGSGIKPGTMVKIMGTSTCDIAVASLDHPLPEIPGFVGWLMNRSYRIVMGLRRVNRLWVIFLIGLSIQ